MRPSIYCCLFLLLFSVNLWCQAPTIIALSPASGGVGDSVTISGTNFGTSASNNAVTFNKKNATIKSWSNSSIQVVVPDDATTGDVVVTVGGHASPGVKFSLPTIESLSTESAAPGDLITIKISDFDPAKTTTVKFNGKQAKSPVLNADSIVTTVPVGSTSGNVVVTNNGKASAGKAFTVKPPEYDQSAFEVLTGVGAELSGIEATSYSVNNDALIASNVGRKTTEILLGGGFILPWHKWGGWIERSYCGAKKQESETKDPTDDCRPGGAYRDYRPWETFLSIRFAPASDQTINGFVIGGGYKITKYFSLLVGYSVTPVQEPSPGFRVAASQTVTANSTIFPYSQYDPSALLQNKPGAFDGFPLFLYNANGVTTTKIFLGNPTVTHARSGIYFGVGIPLNLSSFFKAK